MFGHMMDMGHFVREKPAETLLEYRSIDMVKYRKYEISNKK
jgi:hypothetical protein